MKWYRTEWSQSVKKRKGPQKGQTVTERRAYRTKSLTALHGVIRGRYPGAVTLEMDDSIPWPFGVYAEVIGRNETKA